MVAITVILAAVIAAFVFGLGGSQAAAPTASIVASNNPDNPGSDLKIQHKGGDLLRGGEWKLSIVQAGNPPAYDTSDSTDDFGVGAQIISFNRTDGTLTGNYSLYTKNSSVYYYDSTAGTYGTTIAPLTTNTKYDIKLVHIPSNALLLDQIVEVRGS